MGSEMCIRDRNNATVFYRDSILRCSNMTKKDNKEFNFEKALENLEELVSSMENGELSLEDSLKAFERGIKLTRECQTALKDAEQKVQVLINEEGDTEDMESEGES